MTSYGEARLMGAPRANLVDDLTQVSGLILAFGCVIAIPAVHDLVGVAAEDVDWNGAEDVFPPILGLLANLTVSVFGLSSIFLGFQYLACKWGSKFGSLVGLAITLAAWFPFLVTIARIIFQADKKTPGGPLSIPATSTDSEFNSIAIMGILGFYGYAGTVIGALTFLHWKMYRYFAGYATTYTASYYRSRLTYYGFLVVMVGVVQIALGSYVQDHYGDGQLSEPVAVGPFFILWPEISIAVGLVQFIYGCMILYRSTTPGVGPSTGNKDQGLFSFQCMAWLLFLISVGCQVMGQVALHVAPTPALFLGNVIGFTIFPIYLDVMAHTTPENVTSDMFSTAKDIGSTV